VSAIAGDAKVGDWVLAKGGRRLAAIQRATPKRVWVHGDAVDRETGRAIGGGSTYHTPTQAEVEEVRARAAAQLEKDKAFEAKRNEPRSKAIRDIAGAFGLCGTLEESESVARLTTVQLQEIVGWLNPAGA